MSIGPLRRSVGAIGLVALVPVALMVVVGSVTAVDAAFRATATIVGVVVLGWVANWGIDRVASELEVPARAGQPNAPSSATQPGDTTAAPAADPGDG